MARHAPFDFPVAFSAMKKGFSVTRLGWGRPNLHILLVQPSRNSKRTVPHFIIENEDGDIMPWLAPNEDLQGDDWTLARVVPPGYGFCSMCREQHVFGTACEKVFAK